MNLHRSIRADGDISRLRGFVTSLGELLSGTRDEKGILDSGRALLRRLIATDDWLPTVYALPNPERYQQYLLHCDSRERFSVASFVWGPGQATPIHDHRVWGIVGVLRGAERVQNYARDSAGLLFADGPETLLRAGEVEAFGPGIGDIHRVANGIDGEISISIHVYGANIGAVQRATYGDDGRQRPFISGYANQTLPNLWDRSKDA